MANSFTASKRRSPRGRGRRGESWQGNEVLDRHVITVLCSKPFEKGTDEVMHFGVATDKRATVQQTIARLISTKRVYWETRNGRDYLIPS